MSARNFDKVGDPFPALTTAGVLQSAGDSGTMVGGIVQGAGANMRVGNQIMVKSIELRGNAILSASDTPSETGSLVRLLVVRDRQANPADPYVAPLVSDVLFGSTLAPTATTLLSFPNISNGLRFEILYDRVIPIGRSAYYTNWGYTRRFFSKTIKKEFAVKYTDGATPVQTVSTNNVFMIGIKWNPPGGTAAPEFYIVRRVNFEC